MSSDFFKKSKDIANDYIQSIVFLDDKAYQNGNSENIDHDFDSFKMSKIFAKENKICAIYKPENDEDIECFKLIAHKADVVILDWQINLISPVSTDNPEEDAEAEDPRGQYTKDIIRNIILKNRDKGIKLILVYTGEYTLLEQIANEIYNEIFNLKEHKLDINDLSIKSDNFTVLIRAKEVEIKQKDNIRKYEDKILKYELIPSFVLNEFTKITSGLLSNFALLSLTTVRNNSSKILALFSKRLDPAYLGHKSVLPYQNDAEELLIELFGSTLVDLLKYKNIGKKVDDDLINDYLNDKKDINVGHFVRTTYFLKELISSDIVDEKERFNSIITSHFSNPSISKPNREAYIKMATILFKDKFEDNYELIDKDFAILTHHKNVFLSKTSQPKLSLGTLIKSSLYDKYFLCIQQRCDSVRISHEEQRKFLFLPLEVSDSKFNFITNDGIKLFYAKKSYNLRTLKFIPNENGSVYGVLKGDDYVFNQMYDSHSDEQFVWIMELKDLHAQRIVSDYASSLSRVGLDESEWLRRSLLK